MLLGSGSAVEECAPLHSAPILPILSPGESAKGGPIRSQIGQLLARSLGGRAEGAEWAPVVSQCSSSGDCLRPVVCGHSAARQKEKNSRSFLPILLPTCVSSWTEFCTELSADSLCLQCALAFWPRASLRRAAHKQSELCARLPVLFCTQAALQTRSTALCADQHGTQSPFSLGLLHSKGRLFSLATPIGPTERHTPNANPERPSHLNLRGHQLLLSGGPTDAK